MGLKIFQQYLHVPDQKAYAKEFGESVIRDNTMAAAGIVTKQLDLLEIRVSKLLCNLILNSNNKVIIKESFV